MAFGAPPSVPMSLFAAAAIPATWVPWPSGSPLSASDGEMGVLPVESVT